MIILSVFTFIYIIVGNANGLCTWPSQFVNSTWIDSHKGELVFGTTTMTGLKIDVSAQTSINSWECYNSNGDYLILRTTQTFVLYVTNTYTGYRCLKLKKVTDYSYRYYEIDPPQSQLKYDRISIQDLSSTLNEAILCNSQFGASGSEFQVMIKKGFEAPAAVTCPYNLLSNYNFVYSSSKPSVFCTSTDQGIMDMCSNVTRIGMQQLTCSSTPLYSTSKNLWCVDIVTIDSGIYVSLYNGDQPVATIDGSTTHRFVCLGMNTAGTSMSVTPKHCKSNQTATDVPTDNSHTKVGAVLSLTSASAKCPPCPILTNPLRGAVTITTDGSVTMATYVCSGNYTLSGSETRICQRNGTWSGKEPSCVSVSASPDSEDGCGANLVPAVVVLAILAALLAAAFGGALLYIRKLKNTIAESEKSKKYGPPVYSFPSSKAPLNHMQHILGARHTSLSMAAPVSHKSTAAPNRVKSLTSRTMKSEVLVGSLLLDVVRENTTSSVILTSDNPAPWSKKPTKEVDDFEPTGIPRAETFQSVYIGPVNVTSTLEEQTPRKKKRKQSITKKMQRQSSMDSQVGEKSKAVQHRPSPKPRAEEMGNIQNAGVKSDSAETNRTAKVPRLNISGNPERSSTPVNHGLEIRDPDKFRTTPRTNVIATVQ